MALVHAAALLTVSPFVAATRAQDLVVEGSNNPYNFSTGTASYSNIYVGRNGTGELDQTGGTLNVTSGRLFLGFNRGSSGTYNLSGASSVLNTIFTDVGDSGTGVFNLNGGTHNVSGSLNIGTGSGGTGTYNLNSGTLNVGTISGGQGGSTFNFNGGTLQASAAGTNFLQGIGAVNVRNGGAIINTNGFNVTTAAPLVHSTINGDNATDGGLTKYGAGTLTLSGTNTYTGATVIYGGSLAVGNGASVTGNRFRVTAGTSLTLSGTGAINLVSDGVFAVEGSSTASSSATMTGGTLSAVETFISSNGTGTFTQSGGTFTNTGGTFYLGYGSGANGTYNLNGGTLSTGLLIVGFGANTGTLNQTAGTLTNNGGEFILGGTAGANATYNLNGGTATIGYLTRLGGTGTFNFNGGTLQPSSSRTDFFQNLSAANVRNGGAVINTNGFNVTIAQSLVHSAISGDNATDGGLTKYGAGTLTLSGTNTYTGATTVNAGVLALDASSVTGSNAVINSGGTLLVNGTGSITNGSVAVNSGGTLSVAGTGSISPGNSRSITVNGTSASPGVVSLGGSGNISVGNVSINTGTVNQSGGTFTTNGNMLSVGDATGSSGTYNLTGGTLTSSEIYVGSAGSGTFNHTAGTVTAGTMYLTGGQNSAGTYTLGGTGQLNLGNLLVSQGSAGTFNQNGGTVAITTSLYLSLASVSQGTYTLYGGTLTAPGILNGGGTGTFNFWGGTVQASASNSNFFGGLSAANVRDHGGAVIDTNGFNVTVAQSLAHDPQLSGNPDGGLTKLGAGTLTLSGANTFNGPTQISAGTLDLANANALASSTLNLSNAASSGTVAFDSSVSGGFTLGGLSGNANLILANNAATPAGIALNVGNNNTSTTYSGNLSGAGGLGKVGTGTLTLTGTNTYAGDTVIGGGTLAVPGGSITGGNVNVGAGGTLAISGTGSVVAVSGKSISISGNATAATLNLGGSGVLSGDNLTVGYNGVGVVNQSGGTVTVNEPNSSSGNLTIGTHNGTGTYNLSGGSVNVPDIAALGFAGSGTVNQTGGNFNVSADGELYVGFLGNGTGTYNLSGGILTTGATQVGFGSKLSVFTQTGGVHVTGSLLLAPNAGSVGVYNLNDGLLVAGSVSPANDGSATGGTGTFNFGGGTLRASASSAAFFYGLTTANVRGGGAKIDTNGFDVTVTQPLVHNTDPGAPTLDGGLTKLGAGTLTLTGANTYTGGTLVTGGALQAANDQSLGAGNGAVTLLNGARLLFTDAAVTTGRTYNLGTSTLAPAAGGSITYQGATVNGGNLGAGSHILADGTTLNATRAGSGATLVQSGGTATLNDLFLTGNSTVLQAAGATLNANGGWTSNPQTTVTINGTANVAGGVLSGALTINGGGVFNASGNATLLYLDGSRGTTVNAGGQLNAASGTSIELGGLLVNNGTQTGTLNVNLGGVARGSGSFGTVNVGQGGYFGPNALTTGGAVATINSLPVFHLTGANALAQTAFVGPQLQATLGTANVAGLTLNNGSVFALSIQNAQGAAGSGYDTAHASGTLTLSAGTMAGSQITISVASLNSGGMAGQASNFDPSHSYSFVLVQADGGISGYNPAEFLVDTSLFQNGTQGGSFSVVQQGNHLDLVFTAIPEPSTWALLGIGAVGLGIGIIRRHTADV